MSENRIITVARQYGSGGREIGEHLAALMGVKKYDRELITMSAEAGNLDEKTVEKVDGTAANSLLYTLAMGSNIFGIPATFGYHVPINDRLFILQSDVIRNLAAKESCVIIGRCADYVLRDHPGRISIFVYADLEDRKKRVAQRHDMTESEALDLINKTDRRRSSYYNFYTGRKWGKYDNYHLAVNSSVLGSEGTARAIYEYIKLLEE
ncbi:MAG: cytidylate kinase-like family protein [Clostridia bacterium]|nr:cytidylate kinase-like family protein [Clostridia bacterium]